MSSIQNSANPKVQNANRRSQFFEILALLSLVLIVCGWVRIDIRFQFWVWTMGWSTLLVISTSRAIRYQMLAITAYRNARFNFTPERMHTLAVLQTPEDVMLHLKKLTGETFQGEEELFAKLTELMGSERCAEIGATVFKYTKLD
jgi:hypothetical protein